MITHTTPEMSLAAPVQLSPMQMRQKEVLDRMDLEPVKFKLIKEEGWDLSLADQVEEEYKGYLWLHVMFPEITHVPTHHIDEMWHTHILDTQKYMKDCDALFGFFLHHYPYLGLQDEADHEQAQAQFEITRQLFAQLMGSDMLASSQAADCGGGGGCGGGSSCSSGGASCSSGPSDSGRGDSSPSGTIWPLISNCSGSGHSDKPRKTPDTGRKKPKGESGEPKKKRRGWLPRLGFSPDGQSNEPVTLRGYRPTRADVERLAKESVTRH